MPQKNKKGLFITFEGVDGSGKTTQAKLLIRWLIEQNLQREVVFTREPGGTIIGEKIRELLLHNRLLASSELMLLLTARLEHINSVIAPALAKNAIVVCDRFMDSSYAYQGAGRGLPSNIIEQYMQLAFPNKLAIKPDLTFLIDIPIEKREGRIHFHDQFEKEAMEFHERVRACYLRIAQEQKRMHLLDGMEKIDELHSQIRNIVHTAL